MVNIRKLLKPNGFKIILSLLILILLLTSTIIQLYPDSNSYYIIFDYPIFHWILLILIVVFSYLIGASIDHFIPNKNIKALIAIILGLVSLIFIYMAYKVLNEPTICDPVHIPTQTKNYNMNLLSEIKVDKNAVKDSLNQCLENLL